MKTKQLPYLIQNFDLNGRSWFAENGKPEKPATPSIFMRRLASKHGVIGARLALATGIKHTTLRTKMMRGRWSTEDLQVIAAALGRHNSGAICLTADSAELFSPEELKRIRAKKGGAK